MKKLLLLNAFMVCTFASWCQNVKHRLHIDAGYGLAGSFYVRSVTEMPPFPTSGYNQFSKKRFLGSAQNFAIGYKLNNRYLIKAGINFQHFTREVKFADTLGSVVFNVDKTIHHRDYMYFTSLHRLYSFPKHILAGGIGLYFLSSKMEDVEYGIGNPNFYNNYESTLKKDPYNGELGALSEFTYEYKFQPKVNLGVKAQFYFTFTAMYAESVTLIPFVKISL